MKKINHLAIIMDGNRRWSRQKGLATYKGHYRGYLKIIKLVDWSIKQNIKILSLYAFSTENWGRSKEEVSYLMDLAKLILNKHLKDFNKKGVKVLVSGVEDKLDSELKNYIEKIQEMTNKNTKVTLNICFNYGGRTEIIEGVKKIINKGISVDKINQDMFRKYLFHDLPDPEVIVRTSGEQRLSNFLTWQSVYSELVFLKKHWPAFTEKDLINIVETYKQRQRRFGQ